MQVLNENEIDLVSGAALDKADRIIGAAVGMLDGAATGAAIGAKFGGAGGWGFGGLAQLAGFNMGGFTGVFVGGGLGFLKGDKYVEDYFHSFRQTFGAASFGRS